MFGIRGIARSLLAGIFVAGGVRTLQHANDVAPVAESIGDPLRDKVDSKIDLSNKRLVQANAAVHVVGGGMLVFGIAPRVASLALAASLVPTTLGAHRFWEMEGDERDENMTHALKNAALIGGLIFAALDHGGRPSVFWAGKQAARTGAEAIETTGRTVARAITP